MGYDELLQRVHRLLDEALQARFEGGAHIEKVHAQAYADGYMRALSDAGLVDQDGLMKAVNRQRRAFLAASPQPRKPARHVATG